MIKMINFSEVAFSATVLPIWKHEAKLIREDCRNSPKLLSGTETIILVQFTADGMPF